MYIFKDHKPIEELAYMYLLSFWLRSVLSVDTLFVCRLKWHLYVYPRWFFKMEDVSRCVNVFYSKVIMSLIVCNIYAVYACICAGCTVLIIDDIIVFCRCISRIYFYAELCLYCIHQHIHKL